MPIAAFYGPLFDIVAEMGIDRALVLSPLRLSDAYLREPDARLTHDQGSALVRRMRRLTGRSELGLLVAERCQLEHLDLLGYVLRSSDSLLAGLEAVVRYGRLLGDTAAFRLERRADTITLSLRLVEGYEFEPEAADCLTGIVFRAMEELSRGTTLPLSVHLPRQRPRCAVFYRNWFRVPVFFGAECARLVYSNQCLAVVPPQSDRRLVQLLEQRAQAVLQSLAPTNNLLDRVRSAVARSLAEGVVSLPQVARSCGLSERTLRRRLHAAGLTFRVLVGEVRRERALSLIHGTDGVASIALQLGYRDPVSFSRAFRRWTGATPRVYLDERPQVKRVDEGQASTPASSAAHPDVLPQSRSAARTTSTERSA